ncbi:hypothetical protein NEOLEDRAFT_359341 [Neolentinus lepideus HHB14362 ss-1]|uniref:Methyltransferase domain-containing protein n=1 Tax=Neolentinus lepideus HHB14362 ss-1 TaxID=1314782 RepID=A0A165SMG9_9AGAM|nr:hypothetical protein NEOLEDRAFT_359341 [Neolentinus lepideus HHB14362 ss-1]
MLNPYPTLALTRLRANSSPATPRPPDNPPPAPKQKSRPLTLFAPTVQLARKLTPRRKQSNADATHINIPPPRPPRNPARTAAPKRPSTSSGIPQSHSTFSLKRPSTSSGEKRPLMVSDPISPGGAAITPFASFTDLRITQRKMAPKNSSVSAPDPGAKSRSSNATSLSEHSVKSNNNLSTPDRTILQELKRSIAARDAQFAVKGGKKHHPYPATLVPYPRSYERQVVDFDVWEGQFMQQVCGSVTWHVFDPPPTKVLDIGCGTGTWVLECAKLWKKCHFIGLDLVPLHPDLQQVGSSDLAARITWVQANFLEGLPFPNEEFDFVRVKRIARGVPEDKWDSLFEEISRVLTPGGAFEMIEEDLYFPGAARDPPAPSPPLQTPGSPLQTHTRAPGSSLQTHTHAPGSPLQTHTRAPGSPYRAHDQRHHPSSTSSAAFHSGARIAGGAASDHAQDDLVRTANPRDHSLLETIYTEMHGARFVNLAPLSLLGNYLSLYFKDVRTHPPIIVTFPPPVGSLSKDSQARYHDDDDDYPSAPSDSGEDSDVLDKVDRKALKAALLRARKSESANRLSTYLSTEEIVRRTQPYVNLDSARRIALAPATRASILFSDDPERPSLFSAPAHTHTHTRADDDASTPSDSAIDLSSTLGLGTALSFSFDAQPPRNVLRRSTMPNKTFNFDLRSLNLHLAARVAEIVACAEAMWAWVAEYQAAAAVRGGQLDAPTRQALLGLSRADFDNLVTQFELDMSDYVMLGSLLEQRCEWCAPPLQRTQARKAFDIACKTWADYQSQLSRQRQRVHSSAVAPPPSHPTPDTSNVRRSKSDAHRRKRPSSARLAAPANANDPPEQEDDPSQRLSRTLRVFVAWKP